MNHEITAGLVLGYGFDTKDFKTPDKMARVSLAAAHEMYRRGVVQKVVLVAGEVNRTNPVVATSMYEHFRSQYPEVNEQDVVLDPVVGGSNTRYELKKFRELMAQQGWYRGVVLCHPNHEPRIARNIGRIYGEDSSRLRIIKATQYLARPEFDGRFKDQLYDLFSSKSFHEIASQEFFERALVDSIPVIGPAIFDLWARLPNHGEVYHRLRRALTGSRYHDKLAEAEEHGQAYSLKT